MWIRGARWTPKVNILVVLCSCDVEFECRADRWKVVCEQCKRTGNLQRMRELYSARQAYKQRLRECAIK